MPAAPVGKTKLDRVWTVFEFPEKFTRTPGVATASERVPAISTPVSNQRPGISVSEKLTRFSAPPSRLKAAGTNAAVAAKSNDMIIHLCFFEDFLIADPLPENGVVLWKRTESVPGLAPAECRRTSRYKIELGDLSPSRQSSRTSELKTQNAKIPRRAKSKTWTVFQGQAPCPP